MRYIVRINKKAIKWLPFVYGQLDRCAERRLNVFGDLKRSAFFVLQMLVF